MGIVVLSKQNSSYSALDKYDTKIFSHLGGVGQATSLKLRAVSEKKQFNVELASLRLQKPDDS